MFRVISCVLLWSYLNNYEVEAVTPQIVQRIVTETKPVKGIAFLNCTVAMMNNKDATVKWLRNSDKMELTNGLQVSVVNKNGRFDVRKSVGRSNVIPQMPGDKTVLETYTLIIKDLMESDDGKYTCMVDQSGLPVSRKPSATGIIVVQSPANIQPGSLLVPKVVDENGNLTLECTAKGAPSPIISWTRANGKPLNLPPLPGRKQKPQRFYGKRLFIQNMTRNDRGIYRCHAQNNVGNAADYDVVVEVNFPPKVKHARLRGYYAQSPDGVYSAALECVVSGYPSPDVRFFKGFYDPPRLNPPEIKDAYNIDVEKLYTYGAADLSYDEWLYEVRILNIKTNDFGTYTCLGENKFGKSQVNLTLESQPVCQGALCYMAGGSSFRGAGDALRPSSTIQLGLVPVICLLLRYLR